MNKLLKFVLAAMLVFAFVSASASASAAEDWGAGAMAHAEQRMAQSPLRIEATTGSDTLLEASFQVVKPPDSQRATLAFAVPHGEFTSASISWDASDSSYQSPPTVDTLGYVRGYKIARVGFPVAANQKAGRISLAFRPPTSAAKAEPTWQAAETTGPVRQALERLVANPGQLSQYLIPSADSIPRAEPENTWNPFAISSPFHLQIKTDTDGPVKFTGAELAQFGVPIESVSFSDLRLLSAGEPVPVSRFDSAGKPALDNLGKILAGDQFVFFGRQNSSRYTTTCTYWLLANSSLPASAVRSDPPAQSTAAPPAVLFHDTAVVEEDHAPVLTQNDQFLTILGYRWAWWTWTKGKSGVPNPTPVDQAREITFDLPGYYSSSTPVPATAYFYVHAWPNTAQAIKVKLTINQKHSEELPIGSPQDDQKTISLPSDILRERNNTARLELIDADSTASTLSTFTRPSRLELCFDRLELTYPRAYTAETTGLKFMSPALVDSSAVSGALRTVRYEISAVRDSATPLVYDISTTVPSLLNYSIAPGRLFFSAKETTASRYQMVYLDQLPAANLHNPSHKITLRSPDNSGDYLIITHPSFAEAIKPLAAKFAGLGHDVKVINVTDIYDEFAAGDETPGSIRDFIRYASSHWKASPRGPAASYVLLVGDSTSAYRNQFRNSVFNYVPSMSLENGADRYASDVWLVNGFGQDLLADSFLGRLSINRPEDLRTIVEKNLEYRDSTPSGAWNNTFAFIADHTDFESAVQTVIRDTIPPRFFLNKIFMSEQPWVDNYYFPKEIADAKKSKVSVVTTAMIRDMFNKGAAMVTYFGHGSPNVWSNERIWFGGDSENSDNRMLTNRDKLAFIINMTCNSGAIDYPMPKWNICISEDFMRIPNGGAIACYVPSGPGVTTQHERFTIQLNRALLLERTEPLGAALALANWRYLLDGNPSDLPRMFILLGDPSLDLKIAAPDNDIAENDTAAGVPVLKTLPKQLDLGALRLSASGNRSFQWKSASPGLWLSHINELATGTSTLTTPANIADGITEFTVPISGIKETGGKLVSMAVGLATKFSLNLVAWSIDPAGLADAGKAVTAKATIQNPSSLPLQVDKLTLKNRSGTDIAEVSGVLLNAFESTDVSFKFTPEAGINHYSIHAQAGGIDEEVSNSASAILAARKVSGDQVSVLIDPDSVKAAYSGTGELILATLTATAWNVGSSTVPLSLVSEIVLQNGTVATSAPINLGPAGQKAEISGNLNRPSNAPVEKAKLALRDPSTGKILAESADIELYGNRLPDLEIKPGSITASSQSPSDGETVFFDVPVQNLGGSAAEGVRVEAYDDTSPTQPLRLESQVNTTAPSRTLTAGSSTTFRVRWDPFRNSGARVIRFSATHAGLTADNNPRNNETSLSLQVRTKAKLVPVDIKVLSLTPDDVHRKQIRISTTIKNDGETDAQGVRVIVYSTPRPIPAMELGDVILDFLPAGAQRDVVLTYKLKPGEETRQFLPSCELGLKGSLQRTPFSKP